MTDPAPSGDPREAESRAHEAAALKNGHCPYTGQALTTTGNVQIPIGTLSCQVCDCFGYNPEEVG